MKFPKGKGFDLACGVVVTVVLDAVVHNELVRLTGTFLGEIDDKHHHRKPECCQEFILIQLTTPFRDRSGLEIPEGTLVAINLCEILFIIPGRKCHDKWWCEKCQDKFDDKCFDKHHDKKPVINISCERDDIGSDDATSEES